MSRKEKRGKYPLETLINDLNWDLQESKLMEDLRWNRTLEWIEASVRKNKSTVTSLAKAFTYSKGSRARLGKGLYELNLLRDPGWINDDDVMGSLLELHQQTHPGQAIQIPNRYERQVGVARTILQGVTSYGGLITTLHKQLSPKDLDYLLPQLDPLDQVVAARQLLQETMRAKPLYLQAFVSGFMDEDN